MRVKVKTLSGSMFIYECNPTDSVLQLKYKVFEQTGIPIFLQRFIFRTKELNNNTKLEGYNIQNDNVIHLVFNVNEMMQFQQNNPGPPKSQTSKKRRGTYTKVACTNCRKAHAQCDNSRPCRRCRDLGKVDTCVDAPRKRKRKVKKEEEKSPSVINPPPIQQQPQQRMRPPPNQMPVYNRSQMPPQRNPPPQQIPPGINQIMPPPSSNYGNKGYNQGGGGVNMPVPFGNDDMDDSSPLDDDGDDMYPGDPLLGSSWKSNFMDDIYDEDYNNIGSPPLINSPLKPPPSSSSNPQNRGGGGRVGMNSGGNNNNNNNMNPSMNNITQTLSIDPRFLKVLDGVNPFSNLDEFLGALVGTVVQQAKEIQELKMGMNTLQRRLSFVEGKQQSNIVNSSSFPDFDYEL